MAAPFIEHVNFLVRDPETSAALFAELFDWHERWRGPSQLGGHTIHVGDDRFYLALHTRDGAATPASKFLKAQPLNHIGIVVDDLDMLERRVVAAGLIPFNHQDYEPGRRFYFFDPDGTEFEIVSYA